MMILTVPVALVAKPLKNKPAYNAHFMALGLLSNLFSMNIVANSYTFHLQWCDRCNKEVTSVLCKQCFLETINNTLIISDSTVYSTPFLSNIESVSDLPIGVCMYV